MSDEQKAREIATRLAEHPDFEERRDAITTALQAARREGMEAALGIVRPKGERPCDCERCTCGNRDDAERVAAWDERAAMEAAIRALPVTPVEPLPMVLHCPACGLQHIDEATEDWPNPPHRSHLCHGCGHIWRPADVPTTGVAAVRTRGKADGPIHPARAWLTTPPRAEGETT